MFPVRAAGSSHLSRGRAITRLLGPVLVSLFFCCAPAAADPTIGDARIVDRHNEKILFLTSDAVRALEIGKLEAQKHHIQLKDITRYAVTFEENSYTVALLPPYEGLDGPEFRVEIRRSDMKILDVVSTFSTPEQFKLPGLDIQPD